MRVYATSSLPRNSEPHLLRSVTADEEYHPLGQSSLTMRFNLLHSRPPRTSQLLRNYCQRFRKAPGNPEETLITSYCHRRKETLIG